MALSSNRVMSPDGDSRMNLLYQWCMSSARISSRLEPWLPMGPVRQVHRGRTGEDVSEGEVKPDKRFLSSVLNEGLSVQKEPEKSVLFAAGGSEWRQRANLRTL